MQSYTGPMAEVVGQNQQGPVDEEDNSRHRTMDDNIHTEGDDIQYVTSADSHEFFLGLPV